MHRLLKWGFLFPAASFLMAALAVPGCSKKKTDDGGAVVSKDKKDGEQKSDGKKTSKKTPLVAGLDGTVKGRVVFEGTVPAEEEIKEINSHKDKTTCLKGSKKEQINQLWLVDKETKGVANVVIWLEPPAGKFFQLDEAAKNRQGKVVELRQPHCAFLPHVVALYPKYFDGEKLVETGEKFKVFNDAPITHNTRWEGNPFKNPKTTITLSPNESKEVKMEPESKPLNFACDIHTWMAAKVWIFDNPFFAVTDEKGNFEIKNIPTGTEVNLVVWHEAFEGKGKYKEEKITFKKGDNALDLKMAK